MLMILALVILGVVLHLLQSQLPIDPAIMILIRVIIVVWVCFILLGMFGGSLPAFPRLR